MMDGDAALQQPSTPHWRRSDEHSIWRRCWRATSAADAESPSERAHVPERHCSTAQLSDKGYVPRHENHSQSHSRRSGRCCSVFSVLPAAWSRSRQRPTAALELQIACPPCNLIADAEPNVEEPLEESDLRVAQNTPL